MGGLLLMDTGRAKSLRTAAAVVALAAVLAVPAGRVDEPAHADPGTGIGVDPYAKIRLSINYLMTEYKITEAEAVRRMTIQVNADGIVAAVRAAVGPDLLHAYFDQPTDGNLVLRTSQPDRVQQSVAGRADSTGVRVVRSRYKAAQLSAARAEVAGRLDGVPGTTVGIDYEAERVVVAYPQPDPALGEAVKHRAYTTTAVGVPVIVDTRVPEPVDPATQRACTNAACDMPFRGGLRLDVRRDDG